MWNKSMWRTTALTNLPSLPRSFCFLRGGGIPLRCVVGQWVLPERGRSRWWLVGGVKVYFE
jgi:hypothetical protein